MSKMIMLIWDYKAIKHVPKRTRKTYQKLVQTLVRKLRRKKLSHSRFVIGIEEKNITAYRGS